MACQPKLFAKPGEARLRGCAASAGNLRVLDRARLACQPKLAHEAGERRLAERVGFEPTCRLPDKTLSRRPRYDHFGTSPNL